ncbi:hypothetical protein NIES22_46980 [Calothrix brevissima NIES-22]|nr:hypothetical protein NIES22_46980 [Calothrix brevissima NIES-22]
MSKLVILNLGKGNLHSGFPFVTVQILEKSKHKWRQYQGSLPAAPILIDLYQRWQLLYELIYESRYLMAGFRQFHDRYEGIKIDNADVTHVSDVDFEKVCQEIQKQINIWLDAEEFRDIDRQLRRQLSIDDEIRFVIQTAENLIKKLPWHNWHFFSDYPQAEFAFSAVEFEAINANNSTLNQVKILAILGDSTGININTDQKLLASLPNAETVFLVEPKRSEVDNLLWEKQGWHILFFAGHSCSTSTRESGININKTESLNINQLRNALQTAIKNGLQIAIFNSCQGLALAEAIQDLQIPQIIVMREKIPDKIAQEFLKDFLLNFAAGKSLYLAVRQAREKLQGLESEFPCASWLPVIFQNPAELSPTWEDLQGKNQVVQKIQPLAWYPSQLNFKGLLSLSWLVTILLMGMRSLGIFQVWELKAFDHLMQMRPLESPDSRLLIVGADEKDIRTYGYPLPDAVLAKVVDKLQHYQPAAIGLNIVRDLPVPRNDIVGHQALVNHWQKNQNLITVCAFNNGIDQNIAPPPTTPKTQVGFVDLFNDTQINSHDTTVRRYLLSRSENPISTDAICETNYSLGWQLAYRYFNSQKIPVETLKDNWQFGSVIVKRLERYSGGYQNLDARGNQLLINYRHTLEPTQIAQQVTVRDILNLDSDRFNPNWVKGRIILIGVVAPSVKDSQPTPDGEMRSLYIHAHIASQILSTVENHRPMLWWLPQWGDALWIFCWVLVGSVVVRLHTYLHRGLAIVICSAILYGICGIIFTFGGWLPLVPTMIGLIAPWGVIWIYRGVNSSKHYLP